MKNPNAYARSRDFTKLDHCKILFCAISEEVFGLKIYFVGETVEQVVGWIKKNHVGLHVARSVYVRGRFEHTSEIGNFGPANGASFFRNADRVW